jgi:flagellar biosynthetic protein FliR
VQGIPIQATAFLILFARVGAILMLLPVFSEDAIPQRIRLMIAFAMTAALWGLLSPYALPLARDTEALPAIIVVETLTGLGLGLLVRIMFLAMATAGSIISLQIGMTSSLVVDSTQGGMTSALAKVISVAAAVVCMAMLVHHSWIAAIVRSYATFPVGTLPAAGDFAELAIRTATRSLTLGVSLAAPMIVYGIVFNVALGLSARLAPAIQIFFIAQPLNLLFGLALFATLAGAMLTAFAAAMSGWVQAGWG